MRLVANLVAVCFLACTSPILARAQCGPNMEKQLAELRESWVKNWNEQRPDGVANLYQPHADLLSADGSRVPDRQGIRASLEKHMGSKFEMRSVGVVCSDGLAFDTGSYLEVENGKRVEGNYPYGPRLFSVSVQVADHATCPDRETFIRTLTSLDVATMRAYRPDASSLVH